MILQEIGDNLLLETGDNIYRDPFVEYKFTYHSSGANTEASFRVNEVTAMSDFTRTSVLASSIVGWVGAKTDAEIRALCTTEAAAYGENCTVQV